MNPLSLIPGTTVNKLLDGLGLPDEVGDAIGAMVDAAQGNVLGAARNLIDLGSGLSNSSFSDVQRESLLREFEPGHVPRYRPPEGEVRPGCARVERVGTRLRADDLEDGQISRHQYRGSFAKPIELEDGGYLFRGRLYENFEDLARDVGDGSIDGLAARSPRSGERGRLVRELADWGPRANMQRMDPMNLLQQALDRLAERRASGNSSDESSASSSSASGASDRDSSSILDSNLSLEQKLMLLMQKLAEYLDEKIEEKMGEIETATETDSSESGDSTATGGTSDSSSDSSSSNLQLLQTELQEFLEQRTQMFSTMTNMLKSLHDTSMSAIANMKA